MRLFSNRSQMTSKCGKNKKVAHEAQPSASLILTALVLFNQSDHLNHSNKDSSWLIVTCFIIEIKNAPSASLSYISTREFLRTREKCGEALTFGSCFSHFSSVLKNSQVLI